MYWLWLLVIIPIGYWGFTVWRSKCAEARLLIDSVVEHSLENLGYKPDGASLAFLATHPFLAARLWKMLGDGGGAAAAGGSVTEESKNSCDIILPYVRNPTFRERCPCAGALMQYAIYLCDHSREQHYGCQHPKDELMAHQIRNT